MKLNGKIAVITGAGAGIGRGIATRFAREGAAMALLDKDIDGLKETLQQIENQGGADCLLLEGDVSVSDDVQNVVEQAAQKWGGIDLLVANAGVAMAGSVTEMAEDRWKQVIDINLGGVYRLSHFGIPHLLKRGGGSIVNLTSTQAMRGYPGWSGYAATKGAIISLTRQVASEFAEKNIRCNSIAPGAVDTPMNEGVFNAGGSPDELRQHWADLTPLRRLGESEDIANAALFLASDESSWMTGTCMVVDGGQLAG
jgi:NAD(P)-dependent dehydrogenase (short-subunit alcohol dehydrogenase family)